MDWSETLRILTQEKDRASLKFYRTAHFILLLPKTKKNKKNPILSSAWGLMHSAAHWELHSLLALTQRAIFTSSSDMKLESQRGSWLFPFLQWQLFKGVIYLPTTNLTFPKHGTGAISENEAQKSLKWVPINSIMALWFAGYFKRLLSSKWPHGAAALYFQYTLAILFEIF